jgi:hypothetical protein
MLLAADAVIAVTAAPRRAGQPGPDTRDATAPAAAGEIMMPRPGGSRRHGDQAGLMA